MNLRKATDSGRQDEMDVFEELPYEFVLLFHLTLDDVFTPFGANKHLCAKTFLSESILFNNKGNTPLKVYLLCYEKVLIFSF